MFAVYIAKGAWSKPVGPTEQDEEPVNVTPKTGATETWGFTRSGGIMSQATSSCRLPPNGSADLLRELLTFWWYTFSPLWHRRSIKYQYRGYHVHTEIGYYVTLPPEKDLHQWKTTRDHQRSVEFNAQNKQKQPRRNLLVLIKFRSWTPDQLLWYMTFHVISGLR